MENKVFLSLIVPVYNAELYLEKCFESIKKQTFENYEVIIIDDGSKDNSGNICDKYAESDNRVKVLHVENGGPSRARNIGFKTAQGQYIYCIDNDDYFSDFKYFEKIYQSLSEKPADILFTGASYVRDEKICREEAYAEMPNFSDDQPYEMIEWLVRHKKYETSCWTKVIDRRFLIENEFFFDEDLLVEDLDWNLRFLQKVQKMDVLRTASYIHAFRAGSITCSRDERAYKSCLDQVATINRWKNYFKKYDENSKLRLPMLSFLNYQFFITLARSATLDNKYKCDIFKRLKRVDDITKYSIERQLKVLSLVYRILGFRFSTFLVKIYYTKIRSIAR